MGTNFNGTMINQSVTIAEKAGADIADVRNLILKYDEDGNVVIAANGTAPLLGLSIIEGGYNDISGAESGKVKKGDDLEIQIKDIGYANCVCGNQKRTGSHSHHRWKGSSS